MCKQYLLTISSLALTSAHHNNPQAWLAIQINLSLSIIELRLVFVYLYRDVNCKNVFKKSWQEATARNCLRNEPDFSFMAPFFLKILAPEQKRF